MSDLFPISNQTQEFIHRYFENVRNEEWNSWKWQLKNRISTVEELTRRFPDLLPKNKEVGRSSGKMPFSIPPYYLSVIGNPQAGALYRSVIPDQAESIIQAHETCDPLGEEQDSPTPSIVHRYPNRVLFVTTRQCAVYCRYCTRSRIFKGRQNSHQKIFWSEGIDYIRNNPQIKEVILSGGDPLMLPTSTLESLLKQLYAIPHLNLIRIGTKIPLALPQRITQKLLKVLQQFPPLFMNLHVTHPEELTEDVSFVLKELCLAGVVLGSQTVLLKGVNDTFETLQSLMEKLLANRVRPYALFHCDMVQGTSHFRTCLESGIELVERLRQESGGLAVPQYVVDPPGGKVFLTRETLLSENNGSYELKNWKGKKITFTPKSSPSK